MLNKLSDFMSLQCESRPADESPIQSDIAEQHINILGSNWLLSEDEKSISRSFKFKNYYGTMTFVNAAALVAHKQDHHPDMTVSYNTCNIHYSTHSIGGVSINDFICAAKTDHMLSI